MIIELVAFTFHLACSTTNVVEQSFFLFQTCKIDLHLNESICFELEKYEEEKDVVHTAVAKFQNINILLTETLSLISSLSIMFIFKNQSKQKFILLGLIGKLFYVLCLICNAWFEWSTTALLFTATIPACLTGTDVILTSNVFAYASEHSSSSKKKMFRITLLNAIILSTIPSGTFLGKCLFTTKGLFFHSYELMFALTALILLTSITFSVFLTNKTEPIPIPMVEYIELSYTPVEPIKNKLFNLLKSYKIIIGMVISGLHILQRAEKFYLFLFTQYKLNWSFVQFSNFKTIQMTCLMMVSFLTAMLLRKVTISNLVLIIVGAVGNIIARSFYLIAEDDLLFYIGGIITAVGPLIASAIKCYLSNLIDQNYLHVLFVLTTAIENLFTSVASLVYSFLYISMTKEWIFSVTIITQMTIILLVCLIKIIK